jgi:pyridoxal biosynthesis lyase PdxS
MKIESTNKVQKGLAEMLKGGVIMDVVTLSKQELQKKQEHQLLWHWKEYLPI